MIVRKVDLDKPNYVKQPEKLISQFDIFAKNYHKSGLSRHGLSTLELAKLRPGLIYVSESTYGEAEPWQYRRGAEQLAETVTGVAVELGAFDSLKLFPGYLNDHLTGYLAAFSACAALIHEPRMVAVIGCVYLFVEQLCGYRIWEELIYHLPK